MAAAQETQFGQPGVCVCVPIAPRIVQREDEEDIEDAARGKGVGKKNFFEMLGFR